MRGRAFATRCAILLVSVWGAWCVYDSDAPEAAGAIIRWNASSGEVYAANQAHNASMAQCQSAPDTPAERVTDAKNGAIVKLPGLADMSLRLARLDACRLQFGESPPMPGLTRDGAAAIIGHLFWRFLLGCVGLAAAFGALLWAISAL